MSGNGTGGVRFWHIGLPDVVQYDPLSAAIFAKAAFKKHFAIQLNFNFYSPLAYTGNNTGFSRADKCCALTTPV